MGGGTVIKVSFWLLLLGFGKAHATGNGLDKRYWRSYCYILMFYVLLYL